MIYVETFVKQYILSGEFLNYEHIYQRSKQNIYKKGVSFYFEIMPGKANAAAHMSGLVVVHVSFGILYLVWFNSLYCFFGSEGHAALDRNPGPGYDTLLPGDLLSAFPNRQFHTLPGLLDSRAALPNSNPNACMPMQGGSLYLFSYGRWYDPAEKRTHDLPRERRTRYQLSQPDTVSEY